jgi:hypothetical protein
MKDCCVSSSSRNKAAASTSATLPSYAVRPGVTFPDWSVVTSPTVRDALLAIDHVFACWSGYDPGTDRVRVALLQLYLEGGRAPTASALAERTGLKNSAVVIWSCSTARGSSAPIPSPTGTPGTG